MSYVSLANQIAKLRLQLAMPNCLWGSLIHCEFVTDSALGRHSAVNIKFNNVGEIEHPHNYGIPKSLARIQLIAIPADAVIREPVTRCENSYELRLREKSDSDSILDFGAL